MSEVKTKNVITPVCRASYAHVWEKSEMPNGDWKYSISLIIPKDDPDIPKIKACIEQAGINKFGSDKTKWPKPFWNPLRDGDEERVEKAYANSYFLSPKSDRTVGVVGPDAKPIMDQDEFYSGCYCRASINYYGFDNAGKKGVGVGLNNVMKIGDSERLDGKIAAEDEFSNFASDEAETQDSGEDFLDQ